MPATESPRMDVEDALRYSRWFETELGRRVWSTERRALMPLLGTLRGRTVLDVGCGDGRFAAELAREGARVVGVDISPPMLDLAASRLAAEDVSIPLVLGDVETLPFSSESFDVVVAVTVLCLLRDPAAAVGELARVLRPGGRLVIGDLGRRSIWAVGRRIRARLGDEQWRGATFWTRRDLEALLKSAGLRPVATRSAVFFPPNATLAKLCRPVEAALHSRTTLGAAFLAIRGDKPTNDPEPPTATPDTMGGRGG